MEECAAPAEKEKAEAPAEEAPAMEEEAKMEAATEESAPVEEEAPAEGTPEAETGIMDQIPEGHDVTQLTVCSTIYYTQLVQETYVDGKPAALGEYIGDVTESDDESLIGCAVYAVPYSTWFSNHAVNGQSVPQNIYVEGPNGWFFAATSNEKTISRYTAADVQNAIDTGDTQWIIDTFVKPVEAQGRGSAGRRKSGGFGNFERPVPCQFAAECRCCAGLGLDTGGSLHSGTSGGCGAASGAVPR